MHAWLGSENHRHCLEKHSVGPRAYIFNSYDMHKIVHVSDVHNTHSHTLTLTLVRHQVMQYGLEAKGTTLATSYTGQFHPEDVFAGWVPHVPVCVSWCGFFIASLIVCSHSCVLPSVVGGTREHVACVCTADILPCIIVFLRPFVVEEHEEQKNFLTSTCT